MKRPHRKEIKIRRSWGIINPRTKIEVPKKEYRRSRDKKLNIGDLES